jgi:phosphatidylglycerophosphate synthase
VTTAVLFAANRGPVLERLAEQLAGLGVEEVHVLVAAAPGDDLRALADIARGGSGTLLVGAGDVFTHSEALAGLLRDPRVPSGILASEQARPGAWGVRSDRGRVLSVASPYHSVTDPNGAFLGFLKIAPEDRAALAEVAARVAVLGHDRSGGPADPAALVTVGLVRANVRLSQSFLRELFWARPRSEPELRDAREAIARIDGDRVVLDSAVKATDGFFTTFFVSPYSKYIARWAARRGITPNQVTTFSMALGLATAAAFALGSRAGYVAGAVLLQAAFTLDCVDGQLARYTMSFSKFGAWLDSIFDRAKEYAVYAGLALGASHAGDPVWLLAGAALTLQTVRHALDFSHAASEQHAMAVAPQRPVEEPSDGAVAVAGTARAARPDRILGSWRRLNRLPGLTWAKRIVVFPIGERFAAVSITAALFTPRTAFVVLLAWGSFAALYGLAGRLLRSVR